MSQNNPSSPVRPVRNFTGSRYYPATPERIYEAWSNVEQLTKWWGCAPDTLWKVHAWELREGGAIHVSQNFGGQPFEVRGEFITVNAPHHLRFRFGTEIVDAQMTPHEGGCMLYVQHLELADDEKTQVVQGGWTHALELLATKI